MTYSGTEPETKLCSPGDQTHRQDRIISSCCSEIPREQQSCLLPPSWMSLQVARERMSTLLGQLPGEPAPWATGRSTLEHSCLCERSWHRGVTAAPPLRFLQSAIFLKKNSKGRRNFREEKVSLHGESQSPSTCHRAVVLL